MRRNRQIGIFVVVFALLFVAAWMVRRALRTAAVPAVADPSRVTPPPVEALAPEVVAVPAQRRRLRLRSMAAIATVSVAIAVGTLVTTQATLNDTVTMGQVSIGVGTVDPPTGMGLANVPTGITVSWTAPATGITPASYDVYRRLDAGSYGGSATATPAGTSWTDTTGSQCASYWYKVRSRHTNLVSAFTAEQNEIYDTVAPVITDATYMGTSGVGPVAGFVRNTGQYYVYANVNDACLTDESLNTVTYNTVPLTHGSYTPIAGGTTYNFRGGPYTAGSAADGTVVNWLAFAAADPSGNVSVVTPSVTFDNVAPVASKAPQIVSELTNYFSPEYARGEIRQNTKFGIYADYTDARSGMSTVPASHAGVLNQNGAGNTIVTTGGNFVELVGGSYSTENGQTWNFRSVAGAWTANATLAEGLKTNYLIMSDKVGNLRYEWLYVDVDNTNIAVSSCATSNGGTVDKVNAADTLSVTFDDNVDPGSVYTPGWTGLAALTNVPARLIDGGGLGLNDDWLDINSANYKLFAGTTAATALNLQSGGWMGSDISYATSTLTRTSQTQLTLALGGGATSNKPLIVPGNVQYHPSTSITDPAGNPLTASTPNCPTAF